MSTDPWWSWLVPLALAAGVTWAAIHESLARGRLRAVPAVDNVLYMARGAQFLRALREHGVGGVVDMYIESPPHSPYQTALAGMTFGMSGFSPVAAQAISGVLLAVGLAVAWRLSRAAGSPAAWQRWALLGAAACVPIWGNAVEYFKPDCCAGLLSAVGMVALVAPARRSLQMRRWIFAGLLFAGALLAKPAVFPQTLFFAGIACGARLVYERGCRGRWAARETLKRVAWFAFAALAPVVPHYVVALPTELAYIQDVMWGRHRQQWEFKGTFVQGVLFHITGSGGRQFLGVPGWVLGTSGLLAAAAGWRWRRAMGAGAAAWVLAIGGALLPPLVNHFKNPQFATCFQFLVVFAAIAAMARAVREARRRGTGAGALAVRVAPALVLVAAIGGCTWTFPRIKDADGPLIDRRRQLTQSVYSEVAREASHGAHRVLILGPLGQINHHLFNLWSIRDGLVMRTSLLRKTLPDDEIERRLAATDVIVANEGGTAMESDLHAPPGVNEELIARIRGRAEWRSVATFAAPGTTRRFEVFERRGSRDLPDVPLRDEKADERPPAE
jgi:hypothetical protein